MTDCNCSNEISMLKEQISYIKEDARNLDTRVRTSVGELDARLRTNESKADVTASKLDNIINIIQRINNKLDEFTSLPAKRWEKITLTVITVIVTAGIMYFINSKG